MEIAVLLLALLLVPALTWAYGGTELHELFERHFGTCVAYKLPARTLNMVVVLQVLLGALGVLLMLLSMAGHLRTPPAELGAMVLALELALTAVFAMLRRFGVRTYQDMLVVTPYVGRARHVAYRDIVTVEPESPTPGGLLTAVRLDLSDGSHITINSVGDLPRILETIGRPLAARL